MFSSKLMRASVRGSDKFRRDVDSALQILSTTRQFEDNFLKVVKCVRQSKRSRHFASAALSPGRGKINIRETDSISKETLVLVLAHEAFHNLLYHEYIERWGRRLAGRHYMLDFFSVERRCIKHEIAIAEELNFLPYEVNKCKVYLRLALHPSLLHEQVRIIRMLRKGLHEP